MEDFFISTLLQEKVIFLAWDPGESMGRAAALALPKRIYIGVGRALMRRLKIKNRRTVSSPPVFV
jgi:hypothetical protein